MLLPSASPWATYTYPWYCCSLLDPSEEARPQFLADVPEEVAGQLRLAAAAALLRLARRHDARLGSSCYCLLGLVMQDSLEGVRAAFAAKVFKLVKHFNVSGTSIIEAVWSCPENWGVLGMQLRVWGQCLVQCTATVGKVWWTTVATAVDCMQACSTSGTAMLVNKGAFVELPQEASWEAGHRSMAVSLCCTFDAKNGAGLLRQQPVSCTVKNMARDK